MGIEMRTLDYAPRQHLPHAALVYSPPRCRTSSASRLCSSCALAAGCNPSSAERTDTVVPTAPVLNAGGEGLDRIGVRGLLITYAGAEKAPRDITRTKQEAAERAKMVATIAQMTGEHFQELTLKYGDRPLVPDTGESTPARARRRARSIRRSRPPRSRWRSTRSAPDRDARGLRDRPAHASRRSAAPRQIGARHILIAFQGAHARRSQRDAHPATRRARWPNRSATRRAKAARLGAAVGEELERTGRSARR